MNNFRKGSKGLQETSTFAAQFPLQTDPTLNTLLSVDDFDKWAEKHGYYSLNCEQATLLEARNKLRKKINYTATSPAWLQQGEKPFSVEVYIHGESYAVHRAEDAFALKAMRLPTQVKSYAGTKRVAIKAILGSIKINALPQIWQMRIASFDREIERYLRAIDYQTTELDREYHAIRGELKKLVESHTIDSDDDHLLDFLSDKDDDE